jgi:hypothetical protein
VLVPEYGSNPGRPRMMSTTATAANISDDSRLAQAQQCRPYNPYHTALARKVATETPKGTSHRWRRPPRFRNR